MRQKTQVEQAKRIERRGGQLKKFAFEISVPQGRPCKSKSWLRQSYQNEHLASTRAAPHGQSDEEVWGDIKMSRAPLRERAICKAKKDRPSEP
jgi:hypothetical protein